MLLIIVACSNMEQQEDKTPLVDEYEYLDSLDKAVSDGNVKAEADSTQGQKVSKTADALSWNDLEKIGDVEYVKLSWDHLADVTFSEKFYEEVNAYFLFPEFGDHIKMLDGAPVILKGYLVPIPGGDQKLYALSKNPFSACFFCGNAGPETVAELEMEETSGNLQLDKVYTFRGTLKLNSEDINRMNYILVRATSVSD